MDSVLYGVELELLVRPKLEDKDIVNLFKSKNWKFERLLDRKERTDNSRILRELLAEVLAKNGVPAHLTRRTYDKWIVDRDGSIFEPSEEDGFKPFCT